MCSHCPSDLPEDVRWHDMDLVQYHEPPLFTADPVHHLCRVVRSFGSFGHHGVGRYQNACITLELLLLLGGKQGDIVLLDVRPLFEFIAPLVDRRETCAEDHHTFFDVARSSDADQRFASTTRQHNDSAFTAAIAKHLA